LIIRKVYQLKDIPSWRSYFKTCKYGKQLWKSIDNADEESRNKYGKYFCSREDTNNSLSRIILCECDDPECPDKLDKKLREGKKLLENMVYKINIESSEMENINADEINNLIKNLFTYDSFSDFYGDVMKLEELEYKGTIASVTVNKNISLKFLKTMLLDLKENSLTFNVKIFKGSNSDFLIRLTIDKQAIIKRAIVINFEFYSDQTIKNIEQRNSDFNPPVIDGKINSRDIDHLEVGQCSSAIAKKLGCEHNISIVYKNESLNFSRNPSISLARMKEKGYLKYIKKYSPGDDDTNFSKIHRCELAQLLGRESVKKMYSGRENLDNQIAHNKKHIFDGTIPSNN